MRSTLFGASLVLLGMTAAALAQPSSNPAQPGGPAVGAPPEGAPGDAAGGPSGEGAAVMEPGQGRIILLAPGEVERILRAQQEEEAAAEGDEQGGMQAEPGTRPQRGMMMGERERGWLHRHMPSGAFFRFKRGDAEIVIKCADSEPTTACVGAATALIDKIGVMQPGGAPAGGATH